MKSLTREQAKQINSMTISDRHKKLVRKIIRFINDKNDYCCEPVHYDVNICSRSFSIVRKDQPGKISIDVYFHTDQKSPSLEIGLSNKPDGEDRQFINLELLDLIYE